MPLSRKEAPKQTLILSALPFLSLSALQRPDCGNWGMEGKGTCEYKKKKKSLITFNQCNGFSALSSCPVAYQY